ncbi:hypothetical protein Bbelb_008250 [Branchiostoma belcheri]|nr:hypothetical protein Bbelb_008250 [Branchiostoma belcheri]
MSSLKQPLKRSLRYVAQRHISADACGAFPRAPKYSVQRQPSDEVSVDPRPSSRTVPGPGRHVYGATRRLLPRSSLQRYGEERTVPATVYYTRCGKGMPSCKQPGL